MTSPDNNNRRKFPRVMYPCLITIRHAQGEKDSLLTHTENLGSGGVCAILKNSLKLFAPVDIELDLLDLNDHVVCQGKVVWSVRRSSSEDVKALFFDTGIEFVGLSERDRRRIDDIILRILKTPEEV